MTQLKWKDYSFWFGLYKSAKKCAIQWLPAILAVLVAFKDTVPPEYAAYGAAAGFSAEFLKNFSEFWFEKKLL